MFLIKINKYKIKTLILAINIGYKPASKLKLDS